MIRSPILAALLVLGCRPVEVTPTVAPVESPPPSPPVETAPIAPKPAVPVTVRDTAEDAVWTTLGGKPELTRQTVLAYHGAVRFSATGDVIADPGRSPVFANKSVADVQGERIRILTHAVDGNAAVLLWIDAADVAPQLVREAVLLDTPGQKLRDGDGTLSFAPGEMLDVLERKHGFTRVRTREEKPLSGWIEDAALGNVYEDKPFTRMNAGWLTLPGTTIFVRPSGPALHRLGPLDGSKHEVQVLAEKRGGWLEIEYIQPCRETVRVRGYVRAKTTEIIGGGGSGFGCGIGFGARRTDWRELAKATPEIIAADTELRSADGALVGRTLKDIELRRAPDGVLRMLTEWGLLPVHVK